VPTSQTDLMAATQRPVAASALEEKAATAAWKTIPSRYLIATEDENIPPAAQRFVANRAHSRTVEINASRALSASHPDAVANLIGQAPRALTHLRTAPDDHQLGRRLLEPKGDGFHGFDCLKLLHVVAGCRRVFHDRELPGMIEPADRRPHTASAASDFSGFPGVPGTGFPRDRRPGKGLPVCQDSPPQRWIAQGAFAPERPPSPHGCP